MPIIQPKPIEEEKTQLRIRLKSSICQEVDKYCEWANIKYRDYFIEQACLFVFQQDKEWQKHIKEKFARDENS